MSTTITPVRITGSPPTSAATQTIVATLYLRLSHAKRGVADDASSITRQREHGTQFADERGWTLGPVFVDNDISGAEFEKRDGLMRMIAAAKAKQFHVLIVMDRDRLGREQSERSYYIKKLDQSGIAIWEYMTGRQVKLDSPVDRFTDSALGFAAEMERHQGSLRVYDSHRRRAEKGYVATGAVYGYKNQAVMVGDKRSHAVHVIDPLRAKIVRRIFKLCLDGWGPKTIADRLNREGVEPPPSRRWEKDAQGERVRRKPSRWIASTVRDILRRKLYAGTLEWGKTRQHDHWGMRKQSRRDDPISVAVPHLRIIDEQTWSRVQAIMDARRAASGGDRFAAQRAGVRFGGEKHLLSEGIGRCGGCGGNLIAWLRYKYVMRGVKKVLSTSGEQVTVRLDCGHTATLRGRDPRRARCATCPPVNATTSYRCKNLHQFGRAACPKGQGIYLLSVKDTDRAVLLSLVNDDATQAAWIEGVIGKLVADAKRGSTDDPIADERKRLEKKIANLTDAIAEGGDVPELVAKLKETKSKLDALKRAPKPVKLTVAQAEKLETKLRQGFKSLKGWLQQDPETVKPLLGMLLDGPITFTPKKRHVEFSGKLRVGKLIEGALGLARNGTRAAGGQRSGVVHGLEALTLLNGDAHTMESLSSR
jgi:DNA invertase Pin-like site-specific DNA recombinase